MITGATRLVGLIGNPIGESLSPRMQNAAFAARALDWAYVPLELEAPSLADAVRGLVALRFAGANVTTPYKSAVVELCDEVEPFAARAGSVNTLVVAGGRVLGSTTDIRALDGLTATRPALVGAGGASRIFATAWRDAGLDVSVFSRGGDWPPDPAGADLVVHATPVRDRLLFEPQPGQTIVDLAYRPGGEPTELVRAARAAGCRVIEGAEVLVRQGAASFERWTGVPAPVSVMRTAVGLPA